MPQFIVDTMNSVILGPRMNIDTGHFIVYNYFTDSVKWGILMKLNYTEQQLTQMAQEQFRKLMMDIPFVAEIEFSMPTDLVATWDVDAIVKFSDSSSVLKFNIDVHSNGEKRFVNRFIQRVTQYRDGDCCVFVAPYISEASARLLYDSYCSYMDLSGNCYILTRRIIIRNSGQPNKYVQLRENKNYFSKSASAASAVMRTMLDQPHSLWQVKQLAEITGKAIGTISNVKKFLMEQEWAEESAAGFRLRNIQFHKSNPRFRFAIPSGIPMLCWAVFLLPLGTLPQCGTKKCMYMLTRICWSLLSGNWIYSLYLLVAM